MYFGYIRVSCDKSTVENQRFEITKFCKKNNYEIGEWVEEVVSGVKEIKSRKLGGMFDRLRKGDTVIVSEISRIGRNLMQIMDFLKTCMEKGVIILTVKERYELGDNITSKVLAFAFGLAAEIERNLISARTKEALARKKSEGVVLGRPKGATTQSSSRKLYGKDKEIKNMLESKISVSAIARHMNVHRLTMAAYIKEINSPKKKNKSIEQKTTEN